MATNYDKIAKIYDLLSRIVFGKYIVNAQVGLLKHVPANSRILIVGGGTGWILEKLAEHHNTGLTIDYVESSFQMILLSKKRNSGTNIINFINIPIEDFAADQQYEVIITPFVFDNFKPDKAGLVFNKLHSLLKRNGMWLYADFVYDKNEGQWWQKLLLKIMYLFFRVTCNIEASDIENMEAYFEGGYQKLSEQWYYAHFIRSTVHQKL